MAGASGSTDSLLEHNAVVLPLWKEKLLFAKAACLEYFSEKIRGTQLIALSSICTIFGQFTGVLGIMVAAAGGGPATIVLNALINLSLVLTAAFWVAAYFSTKLAKKRIIQEHPEKVFHKRRYVDIFNALAVGSFTLGAVLVSISTATHAPVAIMFAASAMICFGCLAWAVAALRDNYVDWANYLQNNKTANKDKTKDQLKLEFWHHLGSGFNLFAAITATLGGLLNLIGTFAGAAIVPSAIVPFSFLLTGISAVTWLAAIFSGYRADQHRERYEDEESEHKKAVADVEGSLKSLSPDPDPIFGNTATQVHEFDIVRSGTKNSSLKKLKIRRTKSCSSLRSLS